MTDSTPRRVGRKSSALVTVALVVIALLTWWLGPDATDTRNTAQAPDSSPSVVSGDTTPSPSPTDPPDSGSSGIPACDSALPGEATEVVEDIEAGGSLRLPAQ